MFIGNRRGATTTTSPAHDERWIGWKRPKIEDCLLDDIWTELYELRWMRDDQIFKTNS